MHSNSMEKSPGSVMDFFVGPHGWKIFFQTHFTSETRKGRFICLHGYTEHSGRYSEWFRYLLNRGYDVASLDWPGHGKSEGRRGNIDDFDDYTRTLDLFLAELNRRGFTGPYQLFAHSLGGLISIRYLETSPNRNLFERFAATSPLLGLSPTVFHGAARFFQGDFSMGILGTIMRFLPNLVLPNRKDLGGSCLTHDEAVQKERQDDPLIKPQLTLHWTREFIRARNAAFANAGSLSTPTAFFQAGDDLVVSRPETERFFKKIQIQDKELKIYEGLWHELLNEKERAQVMADILYWFERRNIPRGD